MNQVIELHIENPSEVTVELLQELQTFKVDGLSEIELSMVGGGTVANFY